LLIIKILIIENNIDTQIDEVDIKNDSNYLNSCKKTIIEENKSYDLNKFENQIKKEEIIANNPDIVKNKGRPKKGQRKKCYIEEKESNAQKIKKSEYNIQNLFILDEKEDKTLKNSFDKETIP